MQLQTIAGAEVSTKIASFLAFRKGTAYVQPIRPLSPNHQHATHHCANNQPIRSVNQKVIESFSFK